MGPPAVEAQRSELKEALQDRLADGSIRAVWWDDGHTRRDVFVYDDSSGQSPPPEVLQLAEAVAPVGYWTCHRNRWAELVSG